MITKEQGRKVALCAREYLGTPHVNAAMVKGKGIDCAMLAAASALDAGLYLSLELPQGYSNAWHLHHSEEVLLNTVKKYCTEVKELQEGDILCYRIGRCVSHLAIYVGNNNIVHSVVGQGVILSSISDAMLFDKKGRSRCVGYYRINGEVSK